MKRESVDVLVVGGGAAAGRAAVEAGKYGLKVALVDKGKFGRSGSSPFATAMSVSFSSEMDSDNNWERFVEDTVASGCGLADPALAEIMARESYPRFKDLEDFGGRFQRLIHDRVPRRRAMGQSVSRSFPIDCHVGDFPLILRKEALRRGVKVYEGLMVTRLLTDRDNRVCGAVAVSGLGEIYIFAARSVILGCGSATKLYPYSSSVYRTTGDAIAMGLRAGAVAVDLEFTELTLTPLLNGSPLSIGGIGTMVRWGAKYLNARGERFMERYDPVNLEAANRSLVVEAVYREMQEGRGPVICDFSEVPKEKMDREQGPEHPVLAHKRRYLEDLGRFEWAIVIHCLLGGLAVDEWGRTTVPNLFAIGESAGGVHGAARVAGNAVLETQVFGARAGRKAALTAASRVGEAIGLSEDQIDEAAGELHRLGLPRPGALKAWQVTEDIQKVVDQHLNVFRTGNGLEQAVKVLSGLRSESGEEFGDEDVHAACEARNLALVGELSARAALLRRETRGCHRREDYPVTDQQWQKHIGIKMEEEGELRFFDLPVR